MKAKEEEQEPATSTRRSHLVSRALQYFIRIRQSPTPHNQNCPDQHQAINSRVNGSEGIIHNVCPHQPTPLHRRRNGPKRYVPASPSYDFYRVIDFIVDDALNSFTFICNAIREIPNGPILTPIMVSDIIFQSVCYSYSIFKTLGLHGRLTEEHLPALPPQPFFPFTRPLIFLPMLNDILEALGDVDILQEIQNVLYNNAAMEISLRSRRLSLPPYWPWYTPGRPEDKKIPFVSRANKIQMMDDIWNIADLHTERVRSNNTRISSRQAGNLDVPRQNEASSPTAAPAIPSTLGLPSTHNQIMQVLAISASEITVNTRRSLNQSALPNLTQPNIVVTSATTVPHIIESLWTEFDDMNENISNGRRRLPGVEVVQFLGGGNMPSGAVAIRQSIGATERSPLRLRMLTYFFTSPPIPTTPVLNFNNAITAMQLLLTFVRPRLGLNSNQINQITSYKYRRSIDRTKDSQTSCTICLNSFQRDQILKALPCTHQYHSKCIDKWLSNHTTCPVCRCDLSATLNRRSIRRANNS
ncbi:hypothetical protein GWI33_016091 [Rhynchophorus ferrugineus]|uniref:RING-type domain-containing protein n=1 Tax=Rhynchophorus ferrugineus TaxID=354439 RepID=A0A834I0V1_RHYFE|nr:hypothetical protein GWI33_016091 [Rhynchophorus ferrugineus]